MNGHQGLKTSPILSPVSGMKKTSATESSHCAELAKNLEIICFIDVKFIRLKETLSKHTLVPMISLLIIFCFFIAPTKN